MPRRLARLAAVLMLGAALPVSAQTGAETGLSPRQLMIRLTNPATIATGVSNIGEVIADLVGLEVSTAPLGSSAGGFTFTFDPVTRAFSRAAPSFGPMFAERAVTAGEGRANVGINVIRTTYDTLDGISLSGGSLRTLTLNAGSMELFTTEARLKVTTDTMVMFANVALNNRIDLGVAVPYIRLQMEGGHRIINTATGQAEEESTGAAGHDGIGDIAIRGKLRLVPGDQGGLSLGVDARLPTGDKEALLGAGVTRTLVSAIWSGTFGRVAPNAQFGYEFWSDPFQAYAPLLRSTIDAGRHATVYTAGVEWAASDRLTVNGEIVGRNIDNGAQLTTQQLPFRGNPFGITHADVATVTPAGLRQLSGAVGAKWNFAGSALVSATLLVPLNDRGLRDELTPLIGFDWGF
ncbi:MAG TPA: hypothetical protein VNI78_12680 [Vicinamibacterales bacterium]|nr:hypothetical protein [Vicinamibacterales bacterium]